MGAEIALIAKVVGTAVSVIGTLQAGAAAQRAANFNAQVAANNAHAARLAAAEDAKRQRRLGLKRQGARRALDPDKLDLLEDNAIEEELAVLSLLHAGEVEAAGFENTSALERSRGKAARSSSRFGAAGTLLGAAGKAADGLITRTPSIVTSKITGGGYRTPQYGFGGAAPL
jgi:hypothetical protein